MHTHPTNFFANSLTTCCLALALSGCATTTHSPPRETTIYGPLSAEEKELLGPDADGNGVRDDVDAWIVRKHPGAEYQRKATIAAQWMTWSMLRGSRGTKTTRDELNAWTAAIFCRYEIGSKIYKSGAPSSGDWKSVVFNTRTRTSNYLKWDASTSGMPSSVPSIACRHIKDVTVP